MNSRGQPNGGTSPITAFTVKEQPVFQDDGSNDIDDLFTGAPPAPAQTNSLYPINSSNYAEQQYDVESPRDSSSQVLQADSTALTTNQHDSDSAATSTVAAAAAAATNDNAGKTWWSPDDGQCYYDSPDGWRYRWDDPSQQWCQHEHIGDTITSNGVADVTSSSSVVAAATTFTTTTTTATANIFQPTTTTANVHLGGVAGQGAYHQNQQHQHQQQPQQWQRTADRPNYGRPASRLCAFGFGGNIVDVSPQGRLTIRKLNNHLPQYLSTADDYQVHTTTNTPDSIGHDAHLLSSFPGPLTLSTNQSQIDSFISQQLKECDHDADLVTLWKVLRVLAKNAGTFPNNPQNDALAESPHGNTSSFTTQTQPTFNTVPQMNNIGLIQQHLLRGNSAEAVQLAIQSELWGVALVIATSIGDTAAVASTTQAMAAKMTVGPLKTYCLQFNPHAMSSVAPIEDWKSHLAILALNNNRSSDNNTNNSQTAIAALGKSILSSGGGGGTYNNNSTVVPGHTCLLVAGCPFNNDDFVLVGASRMSSHPRTYASLDTIIRSELYSWSRTVSDTSLVPQYLSIVPYKLIHAYALVEHGMLSAAASYCESIRATLQHQQQLGGGNGNASNTSLSDIKGGNNNTRAFAMCAALTAELYQRLQAHADALKIDLKHGKSLRPAALISKAGKWIDRGLSALMLGDDASNNTSATPKDGSQQQGSFVGDGAAAAVSHHHHHQRNISNVSNVSSKSDGVAGLFGRVTSLTRLVGAAATGVVGGQATTEQTPPPGEPENVFYYDEELKIWRERGKSLPPEPACVVQPPPVMTTPPMTGGIGMTAPPLSTSRYVQAGGILGHPVATTSSSPLLPNSAGEQHYQQQQPALFKPTNL